MGSFNGTHSKTGRKPMKSRKEQCRGCKYRNSGCMNHFQAEAAKKPCNFYEPDTLSCFSCKRREGCKREKTARVQCKDWVVAYKRGNRLAYQGLNRKPVKRKR